MYIKAAEEHLRISRLDGDTASREQHKAAASKALQRAEKIKSKKREEITPVAKDHFSEGEAMEQGALRDDITHINRRATSGLAEVVCDTQRVISPVE